MYIYKHGFNAYKHNKKRLLFVNDKERIFLVVQTKSKAKIEV